jgi:transcriptional regulator with XRE-family HTH domain
MHLPGAALKAECPQPAPERQPVLTALGQARFRFLRKERRSGLHRQTLKKLATGKATTLPPAASFFRLCEVVGLRPLELLGLAPAPGDGEVLAGLAHEAAVQALLERLGELNEARLELAAELIDTLHRHAAALEGAAAPAKPARKPKAEAGRAPGRGARRAQPAERSAG